MAFFRHYECPDCAGTFRFLHHPVDEPPPNFCPLCGSNMNVEPVFVPSAPHIAKTIGKTADNVYRQMEKASVDNMAAAAELAGGDAADYGALKIDDMADYLRPRHRRQNARKSGGAAHVSDRARWVSGGQRDDGSPAGGQYRLRAVPAPGDPNPGRLGDGTPTKGSCRRERRPHRPLEIKKGRVAPAQSSIKR